MEITIEKMRQLIEEAYDCGSGGCRELRDEDVERLLQKYYTESAEYRVYTIKELVAFPIGTIFNHLTMGRCFINARANGVRFMQFENNSVKLFSSDDDPWDKPMKLIHCPR